MCVKNNLFNLFFFFKYFNELGRLNYYYYFYYIKAYIFVTYIHICLVIFY